MPGVRRTDPRRSRREFLRGGALAAAAVAVGGGCGGVARATALKGLLQAHFRELSKEDLAQVLKRLETEYSTRYGKSVTVKATPPAEGVLFGYALDLSRCVGCRRCVYACVKENNQSREPQVQWIKVLAMDKEKGFDLQDSDAYYNPKQVPQPGLFYAPLQCQQCRQPPCTKVCPVKATWKEKDGIVVVDYNWCVGCRCCITACPYGARRFNWREPHVPPGELNPETEYLGNRPRSRGVVEKCTFCLQRVRQGLYPSCVEACPVGARKFGNLLDPGSEVRYILENKRVFVLKSELNTRPQFYFFYGT
jgi:molybdopterin-containing oxidoreductase family iron-sulfur binding subunit